MNSLSNFKLAKHAPDFYEEPRPGGKKVDPLTGYRDKRHEFDGPFYATAEQLRVDEALKRHIP